MDTFLVKWVLIYIDGALNYLLLYLFNYLIYLSHNINEE